MTRAHDSDSARTHSAGLKDALTLHQERAPCHSKIEELLSSACGAHLLAALACLPAACLLPLTVICLCLCPVHHRSLIACTALSGRPEIKHGRAAVLCSLTVIALQAGDVMLGYLPVHVQDLSSVSDVPVGCLASLEAVPTAGWLKITVLTGMPEPGTGMPEPGLGCASDAPTDYAEAGDIALDSWVAGCLPARRRSAGWLLVGQGRRRLRRRRHVRGSDLRTVRCAQCGRYELRTVGRYCCECEYIVLCEYISVISFKSRYLAFILLSFLMLLCW
jgi:hypothetical protein